MLKTITTSLAAIFLFVTVFLTSAPTAQAIEPFIGQIALFGFNFCPRGWAEPNGRLLPISQNSALFSLLGTTYGGDGRTTFALPKLPKSKGNKGLRYCIALIGIFPSRN